MDEPSLSLADQVCLALIGEGTTHGWALVKLLAPDGEIGRIWTLSRGLTYRSIDRLVHAGLVDRTDAGRRAPLRITRSGHRVRTRWLAQPVGHLRDLRTVFLLKLDLCERDGTGAAELIDAQRSALRPAIEALTEQPPTDAVELWRHEAAHAAARFLDKVGRGNLAAMIIHRSPLADVDIPDVAITEHVLRFADSHPDRIAIIDGSTGRSYTFATLRSAIRRFAGGLAARGFGPGDTLGLMAPNMAEYAIVFHGVAVAGGTVTTVNPTYGADEIRFQLQDAGASMLVTLSVFADTARTAMEGTAITDVFIIDHAADDEQTHDATSLFGDEIDQVEIDPGNSVVVLPYSSGTTGLPKGVMLTHRNLVANTVQTEACMDMADEGEVALAFLPFFHIYGMQVLMNTALACGATVVTMPRFDLEQALSTVQQHHVTRLFVVPPIVLALAKHPLVDQYDLGSLKQIFSGAAPLGADLAAAAATRVGCEVVQGYGMTELSPVSHCTAMGDFRPGTSGVTVPNTECRLVDPETGDDRDVGGEGELWVRGPQVMKGYLNNEAATRHTIDDDGWLHTGDVAVIDEHHHVTIVDRVKELIKYKGFQVPPAELEALLIAHPDVADVAVIGVPDEEAGELPKAFVVIAPGSQLTTEAVQAYVAEHMASYKKIRIVEFVDEIPKSASGKILRRLLRDRS